MALESATSILTSDRRAMLAEKGRRLYGKYCGTDGRGICAENFAIYHLRRGEYAVAEDILIYLRQQAERLRVDDPHGRLTMTERLIIRIARWIDKEGWNPGDE